MKILANLTIALLALILFASEGSADSSTIIGDVVIQSNDKNGNFYCDGLICPPKTSSCEVIKHNDPDDFEQLIRVRKCFSRDGTILKDQVVREPNKYHGNVNIHVSSGSGGVSRRLTPEEERQLQEYLDDVQKRIADEVQQNLNNLNEALRPIRDGSFVADVQSRFGADFDRDFNEQMRPFWDGSFGENLRNRINQQVRDSLRGFFD